MNKLSWVFAGIGLALGFSADSAHAASTPYLPIKGSAWRLALGDVDGDGRNELIYGAYEGAVRCINPANGRLLWEQPIGGFPFAVTAADVDGDGKAEVFAAGADGCLYAFGPGGERRWVFRSTHALYDVAVGDIVPGGNREIVCGGVDKRVTLLSSQGRELGRFEVKQIVQRLAVDDFDRDGAPGVFVMDGMIDAKVLRFAKGNFEPIWQKRLTLPPKPGRPSGIHFVHTVTTADLDHDGRIEILLGSTFHNAKAVLAVSATGETLWESEPVPRNLPGAIQSEGASMAITRVGDILPETPGREILVLAENVIRILNAQGRLLRQVASPVGFSDAVIDGRTLWLGSSPNGDETLYRIDLAGEWERQFAGLARQGKIRAIGETLEKIRQQAIASAPHKDPASLPVVPLWRWGPDASVFNWMRRTYPYPNLKFVRGLTVMEPTPTLDPDGRPWNESYWKPAPKEKTMTVEEMVAAAKRMEAEGVPTLFYMGHSCTPWISLATAGRLLEAAPTVSFGFLSAEDEQVERLGRYYGDYMGPLADLCAQHGGKFVMGLNKGAWWFSSPALPGVAESFAVGERRKAMVGAVEDANSRTPELNILGRTGLWMAGLLGRIDVRIISDHFSFSRFHEWEYPRSGHPFLRVLVAHTALGASMFGTNFRDVRTVGDTLAFTDLGRESVEIFFHLIGKGLVVPPRPDQMAGVARIGFAVHPPPKKWLQDAHNGHNPGNWLSDRGDGSSGVSAHWSLVGHDADAGARFAARAFGERTAIWHQYPGHALWSVRVRAGAGRSVQSAVRRGMVAHGWYLRVEGGRAQAQRHGGSQGGAGRLRTRGKKAAVPRLGPCLPADPPDGRRNVPPVFDRPGWLDPADRDVTLRLQLEGDYSLRDLLSGETIPVRDRAARILVPAGALRILEARKTPP